MKAGKIEIRGDREFSNGNFARFPILHRFENGEVEEGCKECNRKERKFTNEERRGSQALRTENRSWTSWTRFLAVFIRTRFLLGEFSALTCVFICVFVCLCVCLERVAF